MTQHTQPMTQHTQPMTQHTQLPAPRSRFTLNAVFALCAPMPLCLSMTLCVTLTLSAQAAPAAPRPAVLAAYGKESHPVTAASARAAAHWQAIAQGNVPQIMADYSPDAVFHWKEGAFEGDHAGTEAIRTVWGKFAKVRSPLTLTVGRLQENGGPQDTRIVTADVTFRNPDWTYALVYRLVFHQGQIIEETWQLAEPDTDPGLI